MSPEGGGIKSRWGGGTKEVILDESERSRGNTFGVSQAGGWRL